MWVSAGATGSRYPFPPFHLEGPAEPWVSAGAAGGAGGGAQSWHRRTRGCVVTCCACVPCGDRPRVHAQPAAHAQRCARLLAAARPGPGGEWWEDYARLALAPTAFRDSSSSFGLWSSLASAGHVFAPPLAGPSDSAAALPWVDQDYTFVSAPVLYPSVAQAAGLGDDASLMQNIDQVIAWLKEH